MKSVSVSWVADLAWTPGTNRWDGLPTEVERLLSHTDIYAPVGAIAGHLSAPGVYRVTLSIEQVSEKEKA